MLFQTPSGPAPSGQTPSERPEPRESLRVEQKLGSVQVSPAVLATLVRMTASAVHGVASVGRPVPRYLRWLPWKRRTAGVTLEIRPDGVHVSIEVVVEQGKNIIEVAAQTQGEIGIAIDKMVGLPVREVNVRIVDVR